jgi:hypothetical protein
MNGLVAAAAGALKDLSGETATQIKFNPPSLDILDTNVSRRRAGRIPDGGRKL